MPETSVLVLALGPVQDFIVRARRTRDLWFGSHLLSELSRAAAASIATDGWTLVFPAFRLGDPSLRPVDGRVARGGGTPLAVVNKVVAFGGSEPEETAGRARGAAVTRWKALAKRAHERGKALLRSDVGLEDLQSAIEDLLEFYAGWGTGTYKDLRRSIDAELAARKNLKQFSPWSGAPRPKSSLDGFRETVLLEGKTRREGKVHSAVKVGRLGDGEQLDAIGFVKRFGGEPEQFPSVSRVAVQPWVDALLATPNPDVQSDWDAITRACSSGGIGRLDQNATVWARTFLFDGEVFFRERWAALSREAGSEWDTSALGRLLDRLGEPSAYVACLAADGDGMGRALNDISEAEGHRALSGKLAAFAAGVQDVVEARGGALVYSGGDDVLALVPAASAPETALALARDFRQKLGYPWLEGPGPTLSVGIGIGHFLTPLGELLTLARRAEARAKGNDLPLVDQRDALAVVLAKRSGAEVEWRARWKDHPVEHLEQLSREIAADRLPAGFAYELRDDVLRRLPRDRPLPAPFEQILRDEIVRTWKRKLEAMKRPLTEKIPGLDAANATAESLESWVAQFGIAKHLAEHDQSLAAVRRRASAKVEAR